MSKSCPLVTDSNITIAKLVPGGQGIGESSDGKKGFFWNVLPHEIVTEYQVTKSKSTYFEAIATRISNPSPHRIAPKDNCFLSTSPWQIMDYNYELIQKAEILKEIIKQANLDYNKVPSNQNINPVKTDGHDFYYRNKMEYALYWDNSTEKISLAFHNRGSHQKIPITSSSIERPEIYKSAIEIVSRLNERHEEARKYQSLLLRCNQNGTVSGGLLENKKPHPDFTNLTDAVLGRSYSYSPNGFFQINLPVYEMALNTIKQNILTHEVLDLYAGVGTIGLSVAEDKKLTLVENNKAAYTELTKNASTIASRQEIKSILANSEDCLSYISDSQTIIVDPPRAGCAKKLLEKLLEVKPRSIIYLSCNPVTQFRDLKILTKLYHIVNITPYNFFPRTPHLENLVILNISPGE